MTARLCGGLFAAAALCGCTSSSLTGDPGTPDGAADATPDTAADTPGEPDGPTDVVVDVTPPPCPAPQGVAASFSVDGDEWPMEEVHLDTPCTIAAVVGEEVGHSVVDLVCGTGAMMEDHQVDLYTTPAAWLPMGAGTQVWFEYVADPVWWVNRWFAIRDMAGNLVVAGVASSRLHPEYEDTGFFDPLEVSVAGGVCEPEPPDSCGVQERQALDVRLGDASGRIFDSGHGYVGDMVTAEVLVSQASSYLDMDCDDAPDSFYEAIIVMIPEG